MAGWPLAGPLPTLLLRLPGGQLRAGVQLCREIRFPEQWACLARQGAQLLVYLTYAVNPAEPAGVWRAHLTAIWSFLSQHDIIVPTGKPALMNEGAAAGGTRLGQEMEVAAMSLSAHERRALNAIEDGLTGAAPELTALLGTFTQLAVGEEMPAWERIRPAGQRAAEHVGQRIRQGGHALRQRPGRTRTFLLLWLTVAIGLITLAVMLNRSAGRGGCAAPWRGVCAGEALARGAGLVLPPGLNGVVR